MRRGTLLLLVGVGIPAALLAAGWWFSTVREVEGRRREALALLQRTAQVVQGVVDASLEEMRLREDARPFDAWNHVYNPPGVVALGDALALSPLARDPEDQRVVGYFQIDAGGRLRTPYEKNALAHRHARSRVIAHRLESRSFNALRELANAREKRVPRPSAERPAAKNDATPAASEGVDGGLDPNPDEPSIAAYNTLQNQVYEELQQPDITPEKLAELALSKKIPATTRQDVDWVKGTRGYDKKKAARTDVAEPMQAAPARSAPPPPVATLDARQVDIDYTPFVFDTVGDELVLYRLVSAKGSRSVQGVLLDRELVFEGWLPQVIGRHSVASARPFVVQGGAPAVCSLRTPASSILEDVDLCFPPETLAAVEGVWVPEVGMLIALVVVMAAAIVVIDLAARRAAVLAQQRNAFITAVSHELRTPLTTLRMHAELLRDGLVAEERRRKFHDDMVLESVRLSHLVENVLEATRLEEGRRVLRTQVASLDETVRSICTAQAPFLQTKGFSIELHTEVARARFNRQAVEQIVVNLLDNAAKYAFDAADKTVRVEVRRKEPVRGSSDPEEQSAVIRVLDRGPGIPADELDRVFHRFHRVQRPGQDHVVGTGIGLALVRELAQAHGGTATATIREGGGCCVEIRIPAAEDTAESA